MADHVTPVSVTSYEDREDGVAFYTIQLSNNSTIKRRYNDIRKLYDALPGSEKKRLHLSCPGKTGIRKPTVAEKNDRLAAFDKLFRTIGAEPTLYNSKACQAFLAGKPQKDKTAKDAKKAGKKIVKGFKKLERKDFKITEVQSFDDFFHKCQEPLDTICNLSENVASAHDAISDTFKESFVVSAGVQGGDMRALFKLMFAEVKKVDGGDFKVKLTDRGELKLKIKGKHAGHVLTFIEAVEKLVTAIAEFVTTAPDLIEQIQAFADECQTFPDKVQAEVPGMSPLKVPGAIKRTSDNCKYIGGVPNEFKEVYENIKAFAKLLKDVADETFGPDSD
jgi:hypothetical protein